MGIGLGFFTQWGVLLAIAMQKMVYDNSECQTPFNLSQADLSKISQFTNVSVRCLLGLFKSKGVVNI